MLPLSGVVTPFLSYGRTAMVANFAMFGILMAVEHPSLRSSEKMRPQAGVGRLKPAPPLRANDLPLVAQAVSPANRIFSQADGGSP